MTKRSYLILLPAILLSACATPQEKCYTGSGKHFPEAYDCIKAEPLSFFHEWSEEDKKELTPFFLQRTEDIKKKRACGETLSAMVRAGMLTDADAWILFNRINASYTPDSTKDNRECVDLDYLTSLK